MKKLQVLLLGVSLVALTVLTGCPGDDPEPEPTAGELQAARLAGTWTISEVTFGGTSRIDTWGTNFTITFSGASGDADDIWSGSYGTSGHNTADEPDALTVWPGSGTWVFDGSTTTGVQSFTRRDTDGDVTVTIASVSNVDETDRELVLRFTLTDPNARTEAIYGQAWLWTLTQ